MARRNIEDWFWRLDESYQRLLEAGIPRSGLSSQRCWQPRTDLTEDTNRVVLKAELAGVRQEDVNVYYLPDRHSLLIRGVRHEERAVERERTAIHRLEIFYGEFEREISLPDVGIDPEAIEVFWSNGFLIVGVPKARLRVNRTRITIRRV